jgi:F-type H+-transporting ATPase subunit b
MTTENINSGKEIIDAAQNAVMQAADDVSGIIENTAEQLHGHEEIFYQSAEFWVGVAFVLVVLLLAGPVGRLVRSMLNKRIDNITKRIHDAAELRDEAQQLLADYEKKFLNADKEAQAILNKSQKEIEYFKKENLAKLEEEMKIKEKEAEDRITASKEKAAREISDLTSELTIKTVKAAIVKNLDAKTQNKLIDDSISLITRL